MIKVYCDWCGEEIEEDLGRFKIGYEEVCYRCKAKIRKLKREIKKLKREIKESKRKGKWWWQE